MLSIEYCARAIIRHLNGDIKLSKEYEKRAVEEYEKEQSIAVIGEMISARTKEKLYQIVK